MKRFVYGTICILFFILISSFAFEIIITCPPNAIVFADDSTKTYYSPVYLKENLMPTKQFRKTTLKEMKNLKYSPDETCKEQAFFHQDISLFQSYFNNYNHRWNADGTWNF